jgi:hypothetical protein
MQHSRLVDEWYQAVALSCPTACRALLHVHRKLSIPPTTATDANCERLAVVQLLLLAQLLVLLLVLLAVA